ITPSSLKITPLSLTCHAYLKNEAKPLSIDLLTTTTTNNFAHQLLYSMPSISSLSSFMVCDDVGRCEMMVSLDVSWGGGEAAEMVVENYE
nr:hypothetical protein [Tanacetum cinerariifolium]